VFDHVTIRSSYHDASERFDECLQRSGSRRPTPAWTSLLVPCELPGAKPVGRWCEREPLLASLERIAELPIERVIIPHGDLVLSDGAARVRDAVAETRTG
jgi:hypothetical protein